MSRPPTLPAALLQGPFSLEDARLAGLDYWNLRGRSWRRLSRDTYVWADLADDPMKRIEAALRRLPPGAAFSGLTAAWLHGLDVPPCEPIEATVPTTARISARSGIALRRREAAPGDVVYVRQIPVMRIERALVESCARMALTEGVVLVDGALHRRSARLDGLEAWVEANAGFHGIRSIRQVLQFAEPAAESPMESRLRMLLVLAGLPPPKVQIAIHDRWGRFVGRPDLFYEDARLGIEYDGGTHRASLAADDRRQNRLLEAGVHLLRFTAPDVLGNGGSVVQQVRAFLTRDLPANRRFEGGRIANLPANR